MIVVHDPMKTNMTKQIIAARAVLATGFFVRFLGLMFRNSFGALDALVFNRCNAVHTFFMRFPIDILCIDALNLVCDAAHSMKPGKVFMSGKSPRILIELPAGTIERFNIKVGDAIIIRES